MLYFFLLLASSQVTAQVIPDKTLPINSLVTNQGINRVIEGGTVKGGNLFHSFEQFSVPTSSTVLFNNSPSIENIFSRVTGSSISNIDGLIKANGVANLFLLNPNGIVFGGNARLDIGGSFLASTANSLKFTHEIEFSATNPQPTPLLTINMPLGLQFGSNPGVINVQGTGHTIQGSDFNVPIESTRFSNGLQVNPGKTLALIGGDILLEGGILSTKNGRIELGSVGLGKVLLSQENDKWLYNYDNNLVFKTIKLSQNALVYINSVEGAKNSINIQGKKIKVLGGSLIFSQNHGNKQSGNIAVNALESLEIKDSTQSSLSAIFTSNFGKTTGEDIKISTNKIDIEGAQIATTTFSDAPGGKIIINAKYLNIAGSTPSPVNPLGFGGINTFSYNSGSSGDISGKIQVLNLENKGSLTTVSSASGQGGNLNLTSENITVKDGSNLGTLTFGNGKGGNIFIEAIDSIKIIGEATSLEPSLVNAATYGIGDAGNLNIHTSKLIVRNGARVDTSTLAFGNAGNLNIQASDLIEVLGVGLNSKNSSFVSSSALITSEILRPIFRLPPTPTGDAGNVTLNTGRLNVANGAQVSVRNNGSGNAGILQVNANKINITNNGGITATTAIGQGGDITLQSKYIQLRNGDISATAGQQGSDGDGGNITINTDILLAIKNRALLNHNMNYAIAISSRGLCSSIGIQRCWR